MEWSDQWLGQPDGRPSGAQGATAILVAAKACCVVLAGISHQFRIDELLETHPPSNPHCSGDRVPHAPPVDCQLERRGHGAFHLDGPTPAESSALAVTVELHDAKKKKIA